MRFLLACVPKGIVVSVWVSCQGEHREERQMPRTDEV